MIYEILDANGAVENRMAATESFVEQQHPGGGGGNGGSGGNGYACLHFYPDTGV